MDKTYGVRLTANVDSYTSAMAKADASTKGLATTAKVAGDEVSASMGKVSKSTETAAASTSSNMKKLGGELSSVGGLITKAIALPVAAAGVAAVKMSSDFGTAFGRMVGLAGVAANEVDGLKSSVLDLAGQTAVAPIQLANAMYYASSSGLDTAHALDAVSRAAIASAAGLGTAQDVVGLVASAMASYGQDAITASRATDILTAAVKVGRADPEELASSLGSILPIAAQLGISFEQVGGATAYLSNQFGDTSMTVTAMRGVLNTLIQPSAQAQDMLIQMGTSAGELKAALDQNGLTGALQLLREHGFAGNSEAMTGLFQDVRALEGATALLNDKSGTLASTMAAVADSTGATDQAFQAISDTTGFKMKQAWAETEVDLIKVGDVVAPMVEDVAGGLSKVASAFGSLSTPAQTMVVTFLGVVAAGGALVKVGGSIVSALGEMSLASGVALGAVGALAAGLAAYMYISSQAEEGQKRSAAYAKSVADALNDEVTALKDLHDAQSGVVSVERTATEAKKAFNDALSAGDNGAKLKTSMGTLKISMDDAASSIESMQQNSTGFISTMLQQRGVTKDVADNTAHLVSTVDDWSQLQEQINGEQTAFNFEGIAKAMGVSKDEAVGLVHAMANLNDVASETHISQIASKFLVDTATSGGDASEQMVELAESLSGVGRNSQDSYKVFLQYLNLLESGISTVGGLDRGHDSLAESMGKTDTTTKDLTVSAADQKSALDALTKSLQGHAKALEADLKAQTDLVDFARGAVDAQFALSDATDQWNRDLEQTPAKLKEIAKSKDTDAEKTRKISELYRGNAQDAEAMADGVVKAFDQASNGTLTATQHVDLFNQSMLQQAQQASGPTRQAILDLLGSYNQLPPEIATQVKAAVDKGDLATAQHLLDDVSEPRTAAVNADADQTSLDKTKGQIDVVANGDYTALVLVNLDTTTADRAMDTLATRWGNLLLKLTGNFATAGAHAEGGYVSGPMLSTLGEGGLPEVVLPLTKSNRMRSLLGDPRVLGPILAALGVPQSADGRVVNITHTLVPAATSSSTPAAVGGDNPTAGNADALMANMFERGDLSAADYDAYLAAQQATEEKYSDREMQIWRIREGIKRDQLQATVDAAKAAQDAEDANTQREDNRMKYLFDNEQISLQQYLDYLDGRRAGYVQYSTDWMSLTQQMQQAQSDADKAAMKSTTDMIAAIFEQMHAQQELAGAVQDQLDTYQKLQQAETAAYLTGIDKKKNQGDRDQANAAVVSAKDAAVQAVIRGVAAQARAQGFAADTPEWAQYVRSQLAAFIPGHSDIADALQAYMGTIPSFALGGYVPATAGGAIVRVAEAGQGEHMVPDNQMASWRYALSANMLNAASLRSVGPSAVHYHDNRSFVIEGALDPAAVGRQVSEVLNEHRRRNGLPAI